MGTAVGLGDGIIVGRVVGRRLDVGLGEGSKEIVGGRLGWGVTDGWTVGGSEG